MSDVSVRGGKINSFEFYQGDSSLLRIKKQRQLKLKSLNVSFDSKKLDVVMPSVIMLKQLSRISQEFDSDEDEEFF